MWLNDTAPKESRPQGAGKNCKSISEARGTLRRLFHSRLFGVKVSWRQLRQRWTSSAEGATLLVSSFTRRSQRLPAVFSSPWHLRGTLFSDGGKASPLPAPPVFVKCKNIIPSILKRGHLTNEASQFKRRHKNQEMFLSSLIFEDQKRPRLSSSSVLIILPSVFGRLTMETMQINSKFNLDGCGINYVGKK